MSLVNSFLDWIEGSKLLDGTYKNRWKNYEFSEDSLKYKSQKLGHAWYEFEFETDIDIGRQPLTSAISACGHDEVSVNFYAINRSVNQGETEQSFLEFDDCPTVSDLTNYLDDKFRGFRKRSAVKTAQYLSVCSLNRFDEEFFDLFEQSFNNIGIRLKRITSDIDLESVLPSAEQLTLNKKRREFSPYRISFEERVAPLNIPSSILASKLDYNLTTQFYFLKHDGAINIATRSSICFLAKNDHHDKDHNDIDNALLELTTIYGAIDIDECRLTSEFSYAPGSPVTTSLLSSNLFVSNRNDSIETFKGSKAFEYYEMSPDELFIPLYLSNGHLSHLNITNKYCQIIGHNGDIQKSFNLYLTSKLLDEGRRVFFTSTPRISNSCIIQSIKHTTLGNTNNYKDAIDLEDYRAIKEAANNIIQALERLDLTSNEALLSYGNLQMSFYNGVLFSKNSSDACVLNQLLNAAESQLRGNPSALIIHSLDLSEEYMFAASQLIALIINNGGTVIEYRSYLEDSIDKDLLSALKIMLPEPGEHKKEDPRFYISPHRKDLGVEVLIDINSRITKGEIPFHPFLAHMSNYTPKFEDRINRNLMQDKNRLELEAIASEIGIVKES